MQSSEQSTYTNWPINFGISHGGGSCSHYCCSSLWPEHWLTSWLAGWPGRGGYEVRESLKMKQPHHYPTKTIVHTYFLLMTHTLPLRPITHQRWRQGWQSALSTPSLINPCLCLSAKMPCQMQNACAAFKAICQRALRPLFTALCPEPANETAGNFEWHTVSGCISDLYFWGGPRGRCGRKGDAAHIASPPQTIKKRYGMNTTLIQSQLLILDHFWVYIMDGVEVEVMVRWQLWWIKAALDKNRTGAQRGRNQR